MADCGLDDEFESWMDQISMTNKITNHFPATCSHCYFFLVHGPHPIVSIC